MGHYIGIPNSRVSIWAVKFIVLTANGVATSDDNCYTFIIRSLPLFAETISHGYCSAAQWPPGCEDGGSTSSQSQTNLSISNCPYTYCQWRHLANETCVNAVVNAQIATCISRITIAVPRNIKEDCKNICVRTRIYVERS